MQTRKKCFETNSSSSHSIVIDEGTDYIIPEILEEQIEIAGGEFGWEYYELRDWRSKASYAYTYAKNYGVDEDLENLKKVIEDYTQKKVHFQSDENNYIDHQSVDRAAEIFIDIETIKKTIFGRNTVIITDNDNK